MVNTIKNLTIENNDLKGDLKSKDKKIEKLKNKFKSIDFKLTEKEYLINKLNKIKEKKILKMNKKKEFEEPLTKYKNNWWRTILKLII